MKIIFLAPWFPTPPVNGSKTRINHLLRALAQQHDVRLISFIRPGEIVDQPAASRLCQEIKTIPFREFRPDGFRARLGYLSIKPRSVVDTYSPEMAKEVHGQAGWADCIVASELVTASYVRRLSKPCVWDDLEIAAGLDAWRSDHGAARLRRWLTWQKTTSYVRRLLLAFRTVTVVSNIEKGILDKIAPGFNGCRVLPNGVDTGYNRPGIALPIPGRLVYSGALTYNANYDAVRYFLAEIFPLIRQQSPAAHLQITGSTKGVNLAVLRLDEHTHLTGFVNDIRPVVAGAWVCVVPLRQGSGTRLKILEAMALGTPVVSTSKGAEGLEVTHEVNILLADDPTTFANQVVRLLSDAEMRTQLVENGRKLVEQCYSWSQIGKDFCAMVEKIEH